MLLLTLLTFSVRASWDSIDRLTFLLEALEDKIARDTATCTPKYSVGHCQMCTDSTQCEGADVTMTSGPMKGYQGAYCCPQAKICLTMPRDTCEGVTNPPNAECERGTSNCKNGDFPSKWAAPTCTSSSVASPVQAPTQSTADQKLAAAQAEEAKDPCATDDAYICVKMCSHCMKEACWKDGACSECKEGLCMECGPKYAKEGCFPVPEGNGSGSDSDDESDGCECMSSIGAAGEKVCEGWNFNVNKCVAIGSCHWGPDELAQCQNEVDASGSGESGSMNCETEAVMNCVDQCSFCMSCKGEECKACGDEPCRSCGEYMACFPPPGTTDDLDICMKEEEEAAMCVKLCGYCVDPKQCPNAPKDCPECMSDKCDCLNDYVQCAFAAL